jgi:integrase
MSPNRKVLETWGKKGRRGYLRLFTEAVGAGTLLRIQYRDQGKLHTVSWEHTRKNLAVARAYAEGLHERLTLLPSVAEIAPITLRDLWERYLASERDAWKPKTIVTTSVRWRKFEVFAGRDTLAQSVTLDTMNDFKRAMLDNGHAPNQVGLHVGVVRAVFRWAVENDRLASSKVPLFKTRIGRALRAKGPVMAEYSAEEARKIVAVWSPRLNLQWRPWALTVFFAYCGPRQNAALHLEWSHVDFDNARIFYAAETDKMGKARWQPMPEPVRDAFLVALGWAQFDKYTGPFVFYSAQDERRKAGKPWTYSAYNAALHQAEAKAGVPHIKHRAAHGFRRGVAGNVYDMTKDEKAASDWIGDSSTKVVRRHYLLTRPEVMDDVARRLGGTAEDSTHTPKES